MSTCFAKLSRALDNYQSGNITTERKYVVQFFVSKLVIYEKLILVIFDLIFAMKPLKLLKKLKIPYFFLWNLRWFQWNPSNCFKGFKKTTFFQKYPSISSKNSTNVVEFYSDIVGYFSKMGVFFETLELFKITKVYPRYDPKIEQNMLKNSVFLKKNRPGWSNFFEKT